MNMLRFYYNTYHFNKGNKRISRSIKNIVFRKDKLFLLLYVDDGTLMYLSRRKAILNTENTLREIS